MAIQLNSVKIKYTSIHHISRATKKRATNHERSNSEPATRRRRSEIPHFDFKQHRIFCGESCLAKDKSRVVKDTGPTLLRFVCNLVSNGEITKASTTLAQCIQTHLTKSYNQRTLGLAVKLHHRFGSKELVTLLHEYGITATYDEVLRFRKSVAIYTANQPYTFMKGQTAN